MLRIKQQHDYIQSFSRLQRNTINLLSENLQGLRNNLALSLPQELNTPLKDILGATRKLLKEVDEMDSASIHRMLDHSYQSACRLEQLTQRFLNYLYLEISTASLQEETDDSYTINGVKITDDLDVRFLTEQFAQAIAEKTERSDDLVCQVESVQLLVSHKHLKWMVDELLDNAFKFSQPQTPVTVRGECQEGLFHLRVSDQGRGMTPKQIASIGAFMQFERQTNQQPGTGLGLKIVQKVVELYNGRFRISSIDQQQTTVHITLPLASARQRRFT
jgi:signal transduction histidine kinase